MGYFSELQINMDEDKLMPEEFMPSKFKLLAMRICDEDYNLTPIQRGLVLYRAKSIACYNEWYSADNVVEFQRVVDKLCNEYEVS